MAKPKCCFGVVIAAALVWADGPDAATVTSAQTSVSARNRRTNMDPPPSEVHTVSDDGNGGRFGNVEIWKCGNLALGLLRRFPNSQISGFPNRSEERRVGKECRSRWSPYH